MTPVDRALLAGPTLEAGRALLGALLVREEGDDGDNDDGEATNRGRRVGRIVEVEAYLGADDLASHARAGRSSRAAIMFGPPGVAYVYLVYGMYHALNVVTEPSGTASALLVRAVEPLAGIEAMRAARLAHVAAHRRALADPGALAAERARLARLPAERLASGPGLVAAAFSIDRGSSGLDLLDPASPLRLEAPPAVEPGPTIVASPRVGIAYAGQPWTSHLWRFSIAGHPSVSRPRPA